MNAAGLFDIVSVYIATPGTAIETTFPRVVFSPPDFTNRQGFVPGDYEITVRDQDTLAIVAGPVPVTLADKGVYGLLLTNAADSVTIDLQYFYDFAP
jgi:hypothetical protein